MMNLAERWGERPDGSNPCRHVEKYRENKRSRFLSADELARLGAACQRYEQDRTIAQSFLALVRLLIFTGARLSEMQKARWDWVDFRSGVLRLPDSKTGAKTIVLPAPALDVLTRLARIPGNPHVITGEGDRYLVNVWKQWAGLRNERGASAQQIGGKGVTQQVGPFELWGQPGALERATNDAADGDWAGQATQRGGHADKDPACRAEWTNVAQVVDQGRTDIHRQRQSCQPLSLAAHDNLAAFPIQIVQGHGNHFAAAQTEPSQQQQNRVVAPACRRTAITGCEQSFNLFGWERLRQV
jgi:hypothetical protein